MCLPPVWSSCSLPQHDEATRALGQRLRNGAPSAANRPQKARDVAVMSNSHVAPTHAATRRASGCPTLVAIQGALGRHSRCRRADQQAGSHCRATRCNRSGARPVDRAPRSTSVRLWAIATHRASAPPSKVLSWLAKMLQPISLICRLRLTIYSRAFLEALVARRLRCQT